MKPLYSLLSALILTACLPAAQPPKPKLPTKPKLPAKPKVPEKKITKAQPGAGALALLSAATTGHNLTNAYLLSLCSECVYSASVGVKTKEHKKFAEKFDKLVRGWGARECKYIHNTAVDTEVVVLSTDKVVVVAFRGSENGDLDSLVKDWLKADFNARLIDLPTLGKGVKVHVGFWKALDAVYKQVAAEIARQGGFTKKSVFVTGHSLGGALATLCALRLQRDGKGKAAVYTYGAPRVGNDKFKAAFTLNLQRWVNKNDLVPMFPPDLVLGYRHVGSTNNIKANGAIKLADKEFKGIGSIMEHMGSRYTTALFRQLPADLRAKVPALAGK